MLRLAVVFSLIISCQALAGAARAADGLTSSDLTGEARGMVVLKLPFGGGQSFSTPRLGFDFQMNKKSDYDYFKDYRDPETGRRLPEVDAGGVRTWQLDPPDFLRPDGAPDRPGPIPPGGGRAELG